jgi:hypothetical protein
MDKCVCVVHVEGGGMKEGRKIEIFGSGESKGKVQGKHTHIKRGWGRRMRRRRKEEDVVGRCMCVRKERRREVEGRERER